MYQCGSKSMPSLLEFDANFEPQIGRVLIFFLLAHLRGLQDYFVSWLSRSSADQTSCQAQLTKRNSPLKIFRLGRVAVAGLIGSYESWIEHINLRSLRHYFEFEFSNNSYFAEVVWDLAPSREVGSDPGIHYIRIWLARLLWILFFIYHHSVSCYDNIYRRLL